jgi:hypothetical protein
VCVLAADTWETTNANTHAANKCEILEGREADLLTPISVKLSRGEQDVRGLVPVVDFWRDANHEHITSNILCTSTLEVDSACYFLFWNGKN